MFSDTFAGIAPASVPAYVLVQLAGGVVAIATIRALYPDVTPQEASEVVLPHPVDSQRADHRRTAADADPAVEVA